MLYTNGVIIVHKNNNEKEMEELLTTIVNHMDEMRHEVVKFEITEEFEFPAYKVPDNITYMEMQDILGSKIAMKAINEDEIVLNGETVIEKRYDFNGGELHDIAIDLVKKMDDKNMLLTEKAIAANKYAGKIKEVDKNIEELKVKHSNEHEMREYNTKIKLNFKNMKKYYMDANDDSIIHKEEKMSKDEMQIRIDHRFDTPVELGKKKKGKSKDDENPL